MVKSADSDEKWLKDVTNAYNSEAFKKYANETFPGYKYPKIWNNNITQVTATAGTATATGEIVANQ